MELWKIGESDPAPKFNLISQPKDWARNVKPSRSGEREYTDIKLLQKEFWLGLVDFMRSQKTFLSLRKARPQHRYIIAVGRSRFQISLSLNSKTKKIGVELRIKAPESKPAFSQLLETKGAIETELGANLDWQELPHQGASRVIQYCDGNFEDRSSWDELFKWFHERSEAFHKVFSQRVISLDLDESA